MTDDEKTLAEHAARQDGKDVQLEQLNADANGEPDLDDTAEDDTDLDDAAEDDAADDTADDACGARTNYGGKIRVCSKEPEHDGKHKAGRYSWRRRSGDNR